MKLVTETLESIVIARPTPTEEEAQGMCLDKGYDYEKVRKILKEFGFTAHIRSRGGEAKEIAHVASQALTQTTLQTRLFVQEVYCYLINNPKLDGNRTKPPAQYKSPTTTPHPTNSIAHPN